MEENCLVRKYKKGVDIPSLEKFNCLTLICKSDSNKFVACSVMDSYPAIKVSVTGTTITGVTSGNELDDSTKCTINSSSVFSGFSIQGANQQFEVELKNFYGLHTIPHLCEDKNIDRLKFTQIGGVVIASPTNDFDITKLGNFINCGELYITDGNTKIVGDMSFISNFADLRILSMNGLPANTRIGLKASYFIGLDAMTEISLVNNKNSDFGDVSFADAFGALTNLTTLKIQGTNITGTVEDFVAAQVAAGRTTCTGIAIGFNIGNVTFNGSVITGYTNKILSWTSANDITITTA